MSVYNTSEEQVCFEELRSEDITEIGSGVCRLSGSEGHEEYSKNEHPRQSSNVAGRSGGDRSHPGAGGGGGGGSSSSSSSSTNMEQEKRMRREIANSNERRRMKSINAGFQSLRTLLPHHEGEKLSKAAILQQTAEYIYQLEQQKTGLLSQNCQLKRLLNQLETNNSGNVMKKQRRLLDNSASGLTTLSETSADEGIGSMSPEPSNATILESAEHAREMVELRIQLGRERKLRMDLEEQVRSLQSQLYPEPQQLVPLSLMQETAAAVAHLQVVSGSAVPAIGQTTVVTSSSPVHYMRSPSPLLLSHSDVSPPPPTCIVRDAGSPTPPPHPPPTLSPSPSVEQRLPSILEAAIKAEPKVEVERLPSPSTASDDVTPQSRLYAASTSRQNLETIVEAIRHLEGDQFINDGPTTTVNHTSPGNGHQLVVSEPPSQHLVEQQPQDAPLALTTTHRHVKLEVNPPYLHFHPSTVQRVNSMSTSVVTALQQQRPGVIVVKHT